MVIAMKASPTTQTRSPQTTKLTAGLLTLALLISACGSDSEGAASSEDSTATTTTAAEATTEATEAETLEAPTENFTSSCAEGYAEGTDLFPNKVETSHAENFSVAYHETYKVLTIHQPSPGAPAESYVLVQCGTEAPSDVATDGQLMATLEIPVVAMLSSSTTHLPLIEQLGRLDALVGVSNIGSISSEAVLAKADQLVEYSPEYVIDAEIALTAQAELLMTGGFDDPAHQILRDADLPVVANAEWLEGSPLGRAEWIKYMAVFFNEELAATEQFAEIEAAYAEVAAVAEAIASEDRPLVTAGSDFGGTYYAPGGASYSAHLINDAGGNYVWADDASTASLEVDLEAQLEKAGDADIWINGSTFWSSIESMTDEDPRNGEFAATESGQVWLYNRISNANGAVDYFERGVTRPDLVLADLLKIFHPELAEDHEFEWYQQLGS